MEDLHNHLANLSLNDLGLGDKYADEVFEVDRTTMISNLKKLLHQCFLNNFKGIQLPNMRKEHGVAFPLGTRRFARIKSSTSTISDEAAYCFAALVQILIATLQAQSRKDLLLLRSIREVYYEYNNMHAPNNLYLWMPKLTKRVDELSCLFSCPRTSLGLTAESGNFGFFGRVILVRKSVATDAEISEDVSILDNVHTINFSSIIRVERDPVPPLFILKLVAYKLNASITNVQKTSL